MFKAQDPLVLAGLAAPSSDQVQPTAPTAPTVTFVSPLQKLPPRFKRPLLFSRMETLKARLRLKLNIYSQKLGAWPPAGDLTLLQTSKLASRIACELSEISKIRRHLRRKQRRLEIYLREVSRSGSL